ncbi:LA_3696 family protein, partial [Desulfofundulus sp.]|uniref:LA_3696 family protein n=1 Tax=Desulfofundulus sp. TaxID=2282750 RepID=UPI003C753F35
MGGEKGVAEMTLVLVPKVLRDKLGDDGAEALIQLLNATGESVKSSVVELVETGFIKNLSEMRS